jgi:formate hydrogenlyase subunit 3/multisubunit Na+/H+ antiporter MnhD subunit
MMRLADHLIIAPIVLPLFAGAIMLALGGERRRSFNAALNVGASVALVLIAIAHQSVRSHRAPSERGPVEPAASPKAEVG